MPFSFALHARQQDTPAPPFYADHLLPTLQSALASLADVDVRYEIERDYLQEWSGPDEVKRRLTAALESGWQRDREPIVQRLTRLEEQIRAPRPAHKPETMRHNGWAYSEQDGAAYWSAA